MNYYALIYHLVDEYLERRPEFRTEHLQLAQAAMERGELVLGGAFSGPADKALLVFRAEAALVVEDFVNNDPYVQNGLVARWEIRPWTVVIGTAYTQ
ncbi:MAG: YciI family protein [Anaerolineaceae bacterium]|nr:YciI family protein [Anaerolineaceae bacterium]